MHVGDWLQIMLEREGMWRHQGDPRAPHVVLRSGLHSDGYIDSLQFLSQTRYLKLAALDLKRLLINEIGSTGVDWVVGSPMAGIPFATAVGMELGAKQVGFTEKAGDKELVCRFDMEPGAQVLHIEEMTTTGGTPQRGIDAVLARNPDVHIIPIVGAFLIRCERRPAELRSAELLPVVDALQYDLAFRQWEANICPLCESGSLAITNVKRVWRGLLKTMNDPHHVIAEAQYAR